MDKGEHILLTAGQKIFEFEIVRTLGQGGFATVFEAYDTVLERRVAIKQLLVERAADKNSVRRFIQEARIIAALEHPNIVSIYALRRQEEQLYMIMEYISGSSLRELLDRVGKLPIEQAVRLGIGICEGLAKFHAKGIYHRDIKAENILLTTDERPKVIDFGIAHVPEAAGGMGLTQAGFQPTTFIYSSPEQVRGEAIDARSDVYQIGELLYYMLAGNHYIDMNMLENQAITAGGTNQFRSQAKLFELLEGAICEEMPSGLKQLWHEVGALAGVVERALAKDKNERYRDAAEFAATLKTLSINTIPASSEAERLGLRDARAYNRRGLAHISTRNYEQAIIEYSRAINLDKRYAEAYNNRAIAHLFMTNYGEAVDDCDQAISLAPDFIPAYVNRGIAYTGLRAYEEALVDYDQALHLSPNSAYAHYNRGNTHLWMTNYQEAITDYSQAIAKEKEFLAAYVNRGVAQTELKNYDLALADFSQAIDLNADYVYAYYNRANVYRELEQHKEAVEDYSKVIELNPEHRYAYENRGDAFGANDQDEQASQDYTRIITQASSIDPKRLSVARSMLMPSTPLDFLKA